MNAKEFFYLVAEMRSAQKAYFETRQRQVFRVCRALENDVDREIQRVRCKLINEDVNIGEIAAKNVDFDRELAKYVSSGIHRFFPNVDDDYCTIDSVIWQDYVIETAKYFFDLGIKSK